MAYIEVKHKHIHRFHVDSNSNELVCICGAVKGKKKIKGQPSERKYHNKTSHYKGYWYDSIKEAEYAMVLDDMKKNGKIIEWERQYPIEVYINGQKIFRMKVDFRVLMKDGSKQLHEVKGCETDVFKIKKKLIDAVWLPEHPEYEYVLIK